MTVRGAIFDFDGTLYDSMSIWDTAGEDYLRACGRTPGPELRQVLPVMSLRQSARYLKEEYGLPFSEEEIIRGIDKTVEDFYLHPSPAFRRFWRFSKGAA